MERYKGKPRFLVVMHNHRYAILRLEGCLNHSDERLTLVYDGIRTRREAEQVAQRVARRGMSIANIKKHIDPTATGKSEPTFEEYLTSEQAAKILSVSTDVVYRLFAGKAGVLDLGFSERRNKRIRRMLRISPSAMRLLQVEFQSKAA